jgi:hypothetical protein
MTDSLTRLPGYELQLLERRDCVQEEWLRFVPDHRVAVVAYICAVRDEEQVLVFGERRDHHLKDAVVGDIVKSLDQSEELQKEAAGHLDALEALANAKAELFEETLKMNSMTTSRAPLWQRLDKAGADARPRAMSHSAGARLG